MSELSNKAEQAIIETTKQNLQASTDFIYDSLVVNAAKNLAKLPEPIFREHFLPYFTGEKPITSNDKVIIEWISVAGTPMSEVSVIDHEHNELFTVPSLFDTNILELTKRNAGNSLTDIYTQYDLQKNNSPIIANKFLNNTLSQKFKEVISDIDHKDKVKSRWNDIFARYGKGIQNNNEVKPSADTSDDLSYD